MERLRKIGMVGTIQIGTQLARSYLGSWSLQDIPDPSPSLEKSELSAVGRDSECETDVTPSNKDCMRQSGGRARRETPIPTHPHYNNSGTQRRVKEEPFCLLLT